MTKIEFLYNLDKDVENFLNSTRSKNNPKATKLQQEYLDKHGTVYDEQTVRSFLQSRVEETDFNAAASIRQIEQSWREIESIFFERAEKIFGFSYSAAKILVYLSTNTRCTYNIERGYFFVYAESESTNRIIMHELLHFYTWQAFHAQLVKLGVDSDRYNDVKESLTELLNLEFADLMDGARDEGYSQHAEMRHVVQKSWLATKDVWRTTLSALSIPYADPLADTGKGR